MYVALVPYSPPTDSPWNRRASSNNAGAHVPIVSYPGRQAITSEPTHIMHTEMSMDVLRPFLSAILPNSHPPMGRIRNPAAKTPAVCRSCVVVFPDGKKICAK